MTEFDMEEKNMSDEAVLAESLNDPRLFRLLIQRYEDAFLRKANTVVHDWEDAADVVQETFIRIYKYGKTFTKREGIAFKSWAYKILMNTAFTHYTKIQKRRTVAEYSDEIQAGDQLSSEAMFEQIELKDSVGVILAKMPMTLAAVLKAHYLDGKSYKDISQEQGITVPALKMRMFRARKEFRTHFNNMSDPRYESSSVRSRSDDEG